MIVAGRGAYVDVSFLNVTQIMATATHSSVFVQHFRLK